MTDIYTGLDKIVIFGGAFDPIHNGHMQLSQKLFEIFKIPIIFMPTASSTPYKPYAQANQHQRLAMLNLAIAGNPNLRIDTREIDNPDYCYSHKTLSQLRRQVGNSIPIYFVIGWDSLLSLASWDYWQELLDLTNFVVALRSDYALSLISPEVASVFNHNKTTDFSDLSHSCGKFYLLDFTPQAVSSTFIRRQVQQHQDIDTLVPSAVANYIHQHKLYMFIFS